MIVPHTTSQTIFYCNSVEAKASRPHSHMARVHIRLRNSKSTKRNHRLNSTVTVKRARKKYNEFCRDMQVYGEWREVYLQDWGVIIEESPTIPPGEKGDMMLSVCGTKECSCFGLLHEENGARSSANIHSEIPSPYTLGERSKEQTGGSVHTTYTNTMDAWLRESFLHNKCNHPPWLPIWNLRISILL